MKLTQVLISLIWLIFPLAAMASTPDDLQRIKQNYAATLIPADGDPFQLKSILASLPPETEMSDQAVVELHQRYPQDAERIKYYLQTLGNDGTWSDINYADRKRSGWEPKMHTERILELAKCYHSKQTPYYQSADVERAIHRALGYWFTARPECLNWWYNQIGVPKTLGTAFILFEEKLTPDERAAAIEVMNRSHFGMTGQNKIWLAGNVLMRALLQDDADLAKQARDTIASEIVTGGTEGIKDDWCFHQHGAQQQFGNYGLSFVAGMSFFSQVFAGTSLAFDEQQLSIINRLIDRGFRPVLWNGHMDISALGRQLFHHAPIHKALSLAFAASELGGGQSATCAETAKSLLAENYSADKSQRLTGHKHFWQSDYTIHRTPHWMASVKMASRRVTGVECMNGDNMQGFYMADGATYIYQRGDEYLNIFPLWDWRKVPGVTAFASDAPLPLIRNYQPGNNASFVGGVTDGTRGMTSMELNRAGIKALKSWIFTDRFVLCMASGIEADSCLTVSTAIDQCWHNGHLDVWQPEHPWTDIEGEKRYAPGEVRFHHHDTGYIVWNTPGSYVASIESRKGQWHDVMQMYRPAEVTGKVMTLYLDHGTAPRNGTYQYLILPHTTRPDTEQFDLQSIRTLRCDDAAHVVHTPADHTWWVAAFRPVSISLTGGEVLEMLTPGIYMVQQSDHTCRVTCTDPTQQQETLQLRYHDKELTLDLSQTKGQSICIDL